jgi:hypothetical protein
MVQIVVFLLILLLFLGVPIYVAKFILITHDPQPI